MGRDPLDTTAGGVSTTIGVAAIGDLVEVGGFALAGVVVRHTTTSEEVQAAWDGLPPGIGLVILDVAAAGHLEGRRAGSTLTVVMPR